MCTLIIGRDVLGPRTVLLAANRDESPGRPSDSPRILTGSPRVVGGRDRLAGGTWLAVCEGPAVVALLNRRDPAIESGAGPPERRSRGLLALDVAASAEEGVDRALALARGARYAPFTLLFASPRVCWAIAHDPAGEPYVVHVTEGWHVLTHQELDDPTEPRAAYLVKRLSGYHPGSPAEAEARVTSLLREHGKDGTPPVCLHQGRMVTVSSSIVSLSESGASYRHAEGPPCERPFDDQSRLLEPALREGKE